MSPPTDLDRRTVKQLADRVKMLEALLKDILECGQETGMSNIVCLRAKLEYLKKNRSKLKL